jgi:hypothetical protein
MTSVVDRHKLRDRDPTTVFNRYCALVAARVQSFGLDIGTPPIQAPKRHKLYTTRVFKSAQNYVRETEELERSKRRSCSERTNAEWRERQKVGR